MGKIMFSQSQKTPLRSVENIIQNHVLEKRRKLEEQVKRIKYSAIHLAIKKETSLTKVNPDDHKKKEEQSKEKCSKLIRKWGDEYTTNYSVDSQKENNKSNAKLSRKWGDEYTAPIPKAKRQRTRFGQAACGWDTF